jgi:hypothetical protein
MNQQMLASIKCSAQGRRSGNTATGCWAMIDDPSTEPRTPSLINPYYRMVAQQTTTAK